MSFKLRSLIIYAQIFLSGALSLSGCSSGRDEYVAAGTFETTEILISAEANGVIKSLALNEGQVVKAGEFLGYIDSTDLYLAKMRLLATKDAVISRKPDSQIQLGALREQLSSAQRERERVERLYSSDAATKKQLDDISSKVEIIKREIAAMESSLDKTSNSISKESIPISIQIREFDLQLKRCRIIAPVDGVVINKYAEQYEMAVIGKPLFKLADLSYMILRCYISGSQLMQFRIGDCVKVAVSAGENGRSSYDGIIEWISDKAEFTPKNIQSKDERDNLVYAMKIRVKNDGSIKIGMYGEILKDANN